MSVNKYDVIKRFQDSVGCKKTIVENELAMFDNPFVFCLPAHQTEMTVVGTLPGSSVRSLSYDSGLYC